MLQLSETTDYVAWDAWVDQSAQGTIFSNSRFLRSLNTRFRLFTVLDRHKVVALLSAIEDEAGNIVHFPFTPYQGILFLHDAPLLPRQKNLDEFRIAEFIVGELTRRYRHMVLPFSWNFEDIRPFLWHNYHADAAAHFTAQPRYTAVLDLKSMDESRYPAQAQARRRRELKKSSVFTINGKASPDDFSRLYTATFARQDITLEHNALALVQSIISQAVAQGYGRLSSCDTSAGPASMCLFLYDKTRAYYLFGANEPAQRNTGAATRLMFDNIYEARRRGLQEFDFVGVNSPDRGDFKLSFNPELKLYFELSYAATDASANTTDGA
jgi:hypothetical protein